MAGEACEETRQLTQRRLLDVRRRLDELRHLEQELAQLAAACGAATEGAPCPALDFLKSGGGSHSDPLPVLSSANHVE